MGRRCFSEELAEKNGLAVDRYPLTEEELRKAEAALAADLEKLSLVEQEKLVFDIHGINNNNAQDQEKIEETLKALDLELQKINTDKKSAYEQALYLNPEYVQGNAFRLLFLDCNEHDPALTADQIVQHFETKRQLFGSGDVLGRPVLLSDLDAGSVECIELGFCQLLPSRDAAGRLVAFMAPGFLKYDELDDARRAMWYFQQATSMEEGFSLGVVVIEYNLGQYGKILDLDFMKMLHNQTFDGGPVKIAAGHFCYDDPNMEKYLKGASLFSTMRHRWRSHFGKTSDVLFKLQTYGILTEDLPVNDEQTIDLGWHRQWLASQRKKETNISAKSFLVPRRFDVLFGRSSQTRVHTGNLRAVHLVEMQFAEYEKATRQEKTEIAGQIVTKIQESYGRFLKWEDGGWVEVDFDTARNKVSHFFRRRRIQKDTPPDQDSEH